MIFSKQYEPGTKGRYYGKVGECTITPFNSPNYQLVQVPKDRGWAPHNSGECKLFYDKLDLNFDYWWLDYIEQFAPYGSEPQVGQRYLYKGQYICEVIKINQDDPFKSEIQLMQVFGSAWYINNKQTQNLYIRDMEYMPGQDKP